MPIAYNIFKMCKPRMPKLRHLVAVMACYPRDQTYLLVPASATAISGIGSPALHNFFIHKIVKNIENLKYVLCIYLV